MKAKEIFEGMELTNDRGEDFKVIGRSGLDILIESMETKERDGITYRAFKKYFKRKK